MLLFEYGRAKYLPKSPYLSLRIEIIVPILVATEAKQSSHELSFSVYDDHIYNPLLTNNDNLRELIEAVIT